MSLKECFEKGLLKKATVTKEMALTEINLAKENLDEAVSLNEGEHLSAAAIFIYTSMFHSARALLFKDSYTERSHACLVLYLIENYVKQGKLEAKFTYALDGLKTERHKTFYGTPKTYEKKEIDELINIAEEFIDKVKGVLPEA